MVPARKGNMSKKFETKQKEACQMEAHQVPVMSFHDVSNYDKSSEIKTTLASTEPCCAIY